MKLAYPLKIIERLADFEKNFAEIIPSFVIFS